MKHLFTNLLLFFVAGLMAQSGLTYQAIVRKSNGQPNASSQVHLKFSVQDGAVNGPTLYSEQQSLTTDAYGYIATNVGGGTVLSGNLNTINWGSGDKILKVECSNEKNGTYNLLNSSVINPAYLRGPQGVQGNAGAKGDQGLQGPAGLKGDTGAQGLVGPAGVKGETGAKGDAGAGVKIVGSVASQANLMIPYTGANGEMIITQDNGNGHVWDGIRWNNIGQIKGPKGDQGIQGLQGIQGANGVEGLQGLKGDKGDQGIQGLQGPAGVTGAKGDKGDKGDPGDPRESFTLPYIDSANTSGLNPVFHITQTGNGRAAITGIYGKKATGSGLVGVGISGSSNISTGVFGSSSAGISYGGVDGIGYNGSYGVRGIGIGGNGGYFDTNGSGYALITDRGNVGIGTLSPSTKLDINGQIKISGGSPAAGKVLTSDANGLATWQLPGGSGGSGSNWENNSLRPGMLQNKISHNQVLISPEPGSIAVLDNTVLTVAGQNAVTTAKFITTNVIDDTKAVEIINQGTSAAFARPIALNIENEPHAQAGIGIKVRSGGTGIEINSNLVALRANGSTAGPAAIFNGGTGLSANGQGTGINSTAAEPSQNSIGVYGQYIGNGSFDGTGIVGISLPTGATVPNGRGFGIGGKFNGGNKGVWAEMNPNPSSTFLTDLRIYDKYYATNELPMAGYFRSKSAIGITAISEGILQHNSGTPYSIGIVGRSIPAATGVTSIGVYGEGEGPGTRVGVMGNAEGTGASQLNIGVKGTARGDLGIAGDFRAAEGINVEATRVGVVVQAPTNVFQGNSTTEPVLKLSRLSVSGGTALQLDNGYLKVSGTNKTAYQHTVTGSFYVSDLNYPGQSSADILIVTPVWTSTYYDKNWAIYWAGSNWAIFSQDKTTPIPSGMKFNIMIIKQ